MSTQLDIVGSVILAGMLMLSIARFNSDRQAALLSASNEAMNQQYMSSVTSLLTWDIQKAGYRVSSGSPFLQIGSTSLTVQGDIDNDGTVDTVQYIWSGAVTSTPNPNDTLLTRRVNGGQAIGTDVGITSLRFQYYDKNKVETANPLSVKTVRVTVTMRSKYQVTSGDTGPRQEYQEFTAALRITPKNIP